MFPVQALGTVLRECVPALPVGRPVGESPDAARPALRGVEPALLLAALRSAGAGESPAGSWAELTGWGPGGQGVVHALDGPFAATLQISVVAGRDDGEQPTVLDQLLWVLAGDGWRALHPDSDREGRPVLDVLPVQPGDLPAAVAPMLAGALAVAAAGAAGAAP